MYFTLHFQTKLHAIIMTMFIYLVINIGSFLVLCKLFKWKILFSFTDNTAEKCILYLLGI